MHPSLSLLFSLNQDEHKRNTSCYTKHHLVQAHWRYCDNKTVGQPGQATAAVGTKGSSRGKGAEGKMDLTASRDLAPWRNRLIAWRGRELQKCDINTHLPMCLKVTCLDSGPLSKVIWTVILVPLWLAKTKITGFDLLLWISGRSVRKW